MMLTKNRISAYSNKLTPDLVLIFRTNACNLLRIYLPADPAVSLWLEMYTPTEQFQADSKPCLDPTQIRG
jgi:hypothetical protein